MEKDKRREVRYASEKPEFIIISPEYTDVDSTDLVFEKTIRDAFEKEGLGHLEEDITDEIEYKKRMLEASFSEENNIHFLIARVDDLTIGTISFGPCGEIIKKCTENELENIGELGSLFVLPDYQNRGIGSVLISSLMKELHISGIESFCLDSGYKRAQKKWIHKFGKPYKIVKDYWGEGSDHMIWLCRVQDFIVK